METSQDKILREKLNIAIRRLVGQGIISSNRDIARDLKCAEPTVSQQRNGTKPLSLKFISRFEKRYNVSVAGVVIPAKGKATKVTDTNTKLLILIAKKLGVRDEEIEKALKV